MEFCSHPFGVPRHVQGSDKINEIMKTSWEIQKQLRVTNACLIVNTVLHRCLKAVDIQSEMVYGVYRTRHLDIPHVWLNIDGHVVDNTFVEDIPEPILITMKKTSHYIATTVRDAKDLYLGDHVTQRLGIDDHDVNQFEWMLSNNDKTLALSQNKLQLDQYFKMMTSFIFCRFKCEVEKISETVLINCWTCNKTDLNLKACGDCKVAKYCDIDCQNKDRKSHKLVCLEPNSY